MTVEILGNYLGNKKVSLLHGPSGTVINTAAPLDNQGDGSSFSPSDLLSASLGACMLTIMGIFAERNGINLEGSKFRLVKHMQSDPRRVKLLEVSFHLPKTISATDRVKLERAAYTCPVCASLNPEVERKIDFHYDV